MGFAPLVTSLLIAAAAARAVAPADSARSLEPLKFSKTVFATAKDIPSPVSFSLDERGAVYTVHSLRFDNHGLFDNRLYPIIEDDATSVSVEDRRRLTTKWVREGKLDSKSQKVTLEWLSRFSEQVRRLEDTDGDGRADRVTVVADSMNDLVQGAAAGVLAWDGRVYATIIPDLIVLADSARVARPPRRVLQTGFGLHMGQAGHDMHGLTIGNDGRLYWSIGDRGFDITTREGRRLEGHTGAVFRCWPDGSGLEVFARGLRNPEELAFDAHGDLFTGDNNADVGDRSRLVYLPEGADAGWTFFLQYVPGCGAWTREHMWEKRLGKRDATQPAWVDLPVGYVGTCPSGLAFYPGTGLPPRYHDSFWLVDYLSGVQSFKVVPRGAEFEMRDWHWAFRDSWGMCDFDFGYDGRLWALYWGESWHANDKARLVTLTPPAEGVDAASVAEVRTLFHDGFRALDDARLQQLLGHADRRVRQRATFEIARRGRDRLLIATLAHDPNALARMHAIWGLGIVAHERGAAGLDAAVAAALADRDPEVRRLAAFTLGDLHASSGAALLAALADSSGRVRFAAAQALGKLGVAAAVDPLVAALAANDDEDAQLRFACAQALARVASPARLAALSGHASRAVRLGAVLALRQARSEMVGDFIADADPQVATEAARAAYDLQLPGAMAKLAATLPGLRSDLRIEPYLRRALHAALRVGGARQAEQVASFAADAGIESEWRDESLVVLAQWDKPSVVDGVLARRLPMSARPSGLAHDAIVAHMDTILAHARGDHLGEAVALARQENVVVRNSQLLGWVADESLGEHARVFALQWLNARNSPETAAAIAAALASRSDSLFRLGFALQRAHDQAAAMSTAERVFSARTAPLNLRQAAVRMLGASGSPDAVAFISARLSELRGGTLEPALRLDVLEAARASASPTLRAAAREYDAGLGTRDPLGALRLALQGGDAARGKLVFENHASAQCIRCHAIDGNGGTAGPDLSLIGAHDRRYLLESLVTPGAVIAPGFEKSGSVMPPMREVLNPGEMRDVIEYLASRRDTVPDLALDSLDPELATTGAGRVGIDRNSGGGELHVAGRSFARGVGVHAPSRLIYKVPADARTFVAKVGLDDAAPGGQVGFEVRVDGRSLWKSAALKFGRLARAYAAIPEGASRIELIVDDGGNGVASDDADWVDAGFLRAGPVVKNPRARRKRH